MRRQKIKNKTIGNNLENVSINIQHINFIYIRYQYVNKIDANLFILFRLHV